MSSSVLHVVNPEILTKIQEDLHENPLRLNQYINLFKEFLRSEKHLPRDIEDGFIENFIRACKYDLEKAKTKFESYLIYKQNLDHLKPGFIIEKESFEIDDIHRTIIISPDLNQDRTRNIYLCGTNFPENFDYKWRQKYIVDLMEWFMHKGLTIGKGFNVIINLKVNSQLMAKIDFNEERKFHNLLINHFPAIIKKIHLINMSSVTKPLVAIIKSLCSEKMRKRIIIHDNSEELADFYSAEILPKEFGGSNKTIEELGKAWADFYTNSSNEIIEKTKNLRIFGKVPKEKLYLDSSYGFGEQGSFRQLQLD